MATLGSIGNAYAYPANVRRFNDGSVIPTAELKIEDRAAWAQARADSYNRGDSGKLHPKTADDVLREEDESERMQLKMAQGMENFLAGKGIPVNGTTPEMMARAIEQVREARSKPYVYHDGPVVIGAMNVNSAVSAQKSMTGGDLQSLALYGDYLRNEVAAAIKSRPDVSFQGAWVKDRVTNDVNEYMGWIMKAIQQASSKADSSTTVQI